MHSRQLEVPVLKESPPEIDEQEMWDEFESGRSRTSLLDANSADGFNPGQKHEAEFIRALDRAGVNDPAEWGFMDFDVECDVDETQTNVMQGLGQLRRLCFWIKRGLPLNKTSKTCLQKTLPLLILGLPILQVPKSQTNGFRIRTKL
jgi:hypothetical protein